MSLDADFEKKYNDMSENLRNLSEKQKRLENNYYDLLRAVLGDRYNESNLDSTFALEDAIKLSIYRRGMHNMIDPQFKLYNGEEEDE